MQFLLFLCETGRLTANQFVEVCAKQVQRQEPIGRIAIRRGALSMRQIFEILECQAQQDRPFGEIAVSLGYLSRQKLASFLRMQQEERPSLESIALELGFTDAAALREARLDYRHRQYEKHCERSVETTLSMGSPTRQDAGHGFKNPPLVKRLEATRKGPFVMASADRIRNSQ